ncbi:tail fiber protein [Mangrovimicrobium sediminis]|uniref:Tail fiber protein n=1 Tax=Mangrovimicrobium sediminis TaxID=2562682 RepID=A0A4Z0M209_9GAMM|nr:phage tail protein [Haliea sp. SAOS-164]TGD73520.1 tail fiber protein [Haliea sp. SAOS-164]
MALNVPVGTILPFAGDIDETALAAAGYLPCDGRELDRTDTQYIALFNVIGTSNGGNGNPDFLLPDLRGQFVRTLDGLAQRDPDAAKRQAAASGGASGDNVGSVQDSATAGPSIAFTTDSQGDHDHLVPGLPDEEYDCAAAITGNKGAAWKSGSNNTSTDGAHEHNILGGDTESRPGNVYMNWIIRFSLAADDSTTPIGSIVAYGADAGSNAVALAAQGWQACRGRTVAATDFPELFAAIGTLYGGDSSNFDLPDLRGLFIRGVADGATHAEGGARDPDEHRRFRQDTGFPQSSVGSLQSFATALPVTREFTLVSTGLHDHNAPHLPVSTYIENACAGHSVTKFGPLTATTSSAGSHTHNVTGGGDDETRPINVYVDHIIKVKQV